MRIKKLYASIGTVYGGGIFCTLSEVSKADYHRGVMHDKATIDTREVATVKTARRHAREFAYLLGAELIWENE